MTFVAPLLLALTVAGGQTNNPDPSAARCGVNPWKDAIRLFVEKDGNLWQEIHATNKHKVIDLKDDEHTLAQMYSGKRNHIYLTTDAPSEDFTIYEQYCFGDDGKVLGRHYEIRTAWGWVYEVSTTYDKSGKPLDSAKRFFDTRSEKTIKRPDEALDIWLKPTNYLSLDQLPFIKLWRVNTVAQTH